MKSYIAHGFLLSQGIISVLIIVLMATVVIIGGHTYINAGKCSTAAADTSSLGGISGSIVWKSVLILPSLRM